MNRLDCVIIGHNTGNFQDYIAESKSMARFNGAYRNAQINSLLLDGRRISYMDLFNSVRKQKTSGDFLTSSYPTGGIGLSAIAPRGLRT